MNNFDSAMTIHLNSQDVGQCNLKLLTLFRNLALKEEHELLEKFQVSTHVAELLADIPPAKLKNRPGILLPLWDLSCGEDASQWDGLTVSDQQTAISQQVNEINRMQLHLLSTATYTDMKLAEIYFGAHESIIRMVISLNLEVMDKLCCSGEPIAVLKKGADVAYWKQIIKAYFSDSTKNEETAAYHTIMLSLANQISALDSNNAVPDCA